MLLPWTIQDPPLVLQDPRPHPPPQVRLISRKTIIGNMCSCGQNIYLMKSETNNKVWEYNESCLETHECMKFWNSSCSKNAVWNTCQFLWRRWSKAPHKDYFVCCLSVHHALLLLPPHVFYRTLVYFLKIAFKGWSMNNFYITGTGQFSCNFDTGPCGWTQDKGDNFDWTRNRGSTGSTGTGPNNDHTQGSK